MKVTLWGTRGSLASPGPDTVRYGGNTSCVSVTGSEGSLLVLDAGTGIRLLGLQLPPDLTCVHILLTHLHMDHVQGLPFFMPLRRAGVEVHIWGPASTTLNLEARLKRYLSPPLFPVRVRDLLSVLHFHELATKSIEMGGGNRFLPLVLGPAVVPEVTDEAEAQADPELAVLSAMAHGRDADTGKSAQIAFAARMASYGLDEDRSKLYFDLVLASLSEAARRELQTMDPAKYEYQSEFARRYVAQGKAEGILKGRADLVMRQLTLRFGPLSGEAVIRISEASIEELDAIGERLLTAETLRDALAPT